MTRAHRPPSGLPGAGLFGAPALAGRAASNPPAWPPAPTVLPHVTARVVRPFRLDRIGACYEVDLVVGGLLRIRTLSCGGRLSFGFVRGEQSVEVLDSALDGLLRRAVVEAVSDAEWRGAGR